MKVLSGNFSQAKNVEERHLPSAWTLVSAAPVHKGASFKSYAAAKLYPPRSLREMAKAGGTLQASDELNRGKAATKFASKPGGQQLTQCSPQDYHIKGSPEKGPHGGESHPAY